MRRTLKQVIPLLAVFAVVATGVAVAYMNWGQFLTAEDRKQLALFQEVVGAVKNRYVDDVDGKKLMQGAINGMLSSLDPHSAYLPPEPYHEMKVEMAGEFGGLGIEINSVDGRLTVVAPIEDTPAFRAGIKANDQIAKIDDTPTKGITTNKAVKLMRGAKGTKVVLSILRQGESKPLIFPLVRDIIKTKSVKFKMLDSGFGYIRILQFQERTGEEFSKALQALREQQGGALRGLVLDLRHNPGGLVDAAVAVANRFVGEGLRDGLIFYSQGRTATGKQEVNASIGEKEPRYPMVVLINGSSASASEIVAGALQDHKRAIIMGTPSFGKGSIQTILPLRNGAGVKLTTARYYTPSGRSIQARGITPDIEVGSMDVPAAKKDVVFQEKDLENHLSGADRSNSGKAPALPLSPNMADGETAHDYQLARALELVRTLDLVQKTVWVR